MKSAHNGIKAELITWIADNSKLITEPNYRVLNGKIEMVCRGMYKEVEELSTGICIPVKYMLKRKV